MNDASARKLTNASTTTVRTFRNRTSRRERGGGDHTHTKTRARARTTEAMGAAVICTARAAGAANPEAACSQLQTRLTKTRGGERGFVITNTRAVQRTPSVEHPPPSTLKTLKQNRADGTVSTASPASASRASASSPGLWRRRTVERFRAVADANTNRYSLRFGSGGGSHPLSDRDDDGRDERGQGGAPVAPHGAPRGDEPQRRGGEPSRGFLGDAPPELGGVEERVGMAREPSHRWPVRRAERPRQHDQAEDKAE